jgi:hypothetical protein
MKCIRCKVKQGRICGACVEDSFCLTCGKQLDRIYYPDSTLEKATRKKALTEVIRIMQKRMDKFGQSLDYGDYSNTLLQVKELRGAIK